MRRKVLQDIANTLCPMLVGWRMHDDLEVLSDLPSGSIEFDLIQSHAVHSQKGEVKLYITCELRTWMFRQFQENKIDKEKIKKAVVVANIDTDKIKTDKKRIVFFHWNVESTIETDEKTYKGYLKEEHKWHKRINTIS